MVGCTVVDLMSIQSLASLPVSIGQVLASLKGDEGHPSPLLDDTHERRAGTRQFLKESAPDSDIKPSHSRCEAQRGLRCVLVNEETINTAFSKKKLTESI